MTRTRDPGAQPSVSPPAPVHAPRDVSPVHGHEMGVGAGELWLDLLSTVLSPTIQEPELGLSGAPTPFLDSPDEARKSPILQVSQLSLGSRE